MKKGLAIILLFCVFISCKREKDPDKFGPEIIISPPDFTVSGFTVSPSNTVNLANDDVYFNCSMPQRAEFKIIIYGLLSGAVKVLSGAGEYIDISNSTWTGDSDNFNIFRSGEDCFVILSFRGATKEYYDTITIAAANVYPRTLLINDFEGIAFDKTAGNVAAYGTYFDAGDLSETDIRSDDELMTNQGMQSALFDGRDLNSSFYVGGMYFAPAVAPYAFETYSPDSLYLNAYVYSYGDNNTNLIFAYTEDENGNNISDNTGDEVWTYELALAGKGWTLVSLRLKHFVDEKATVGNGVRNLDKIVGFNVNIKSRKAGGRVKANIDYLTVTYGRPFRP